MAHIHWSCRSKIIMPWLYHALFQPSQILWSYQILRNWIISIFTFYCTDTTTPSLATWCWNRFNGSNQGIKLRPCRGIGRTSIWYVYCSQCFNLKSLWSNWTNLKILINMWNINNCIYTVWTYRCTYWVLICAKTCHIVSIYTNPDYGEGSQSSTKYPKNNLLK